MRSINLVAALALVCGMCLPVRADQPAYSLDDVTNVQPVLDPGPKPDPGDMARYHPYLADGHAELFATGAVFFKDKPPLRCTSRERAFLLPDTPYTRWTLGWYAHETLAHDDLPSSGALRNLRAPEMLDITKPSAAIRKTICTGDGDLIFRNLPPGRYLMIMQMQGAFLYQRPDEKHYTSGASHTDRDVDWYVSTTPGGMATAFTDGFVLIGGPYDLKENDGAFYGGALRVAAHFR